MWNKWPLGFSFLIISAIFLIISFNPSLTGNVVGTNTNAPYFYFISLVFFILSILIFVSRKTLDAILIPTGTPEADKRRTDRAVKEYIGGGSHVLMITGRIDQPVKTSQVYNIYKRLRSYGIKPGEMRVEGKSANTLENVLFSLEKLKKMGAHEVGIASNPTHLDRFEYVIKKAKEEGIVDKDFRVHRLPTSETFGEWAYGVLANLKYRYKLRKGLPKK